MASRRELEVQLATVAKDHLRLHCQLEDDAFIEKSAYDLFLMTYQSVESTLRMREEARANHDFDQFRTADLELWKYGFAIYTFAFAEKLGWMICFIPQPIS